MSRPLLTLAQYLAQVSLTPRQLGMLASLRLTEPRSLADWSAALALILAEPLTSWELDSTGFEAVAGGAGGMSGTNAQRRAFDATTLTQKTQWNVTDGNRPTYWFTPNDAAWRDSSGNNPDYVNPNPPPPDTGEI